MPEQGIRHIGNAPQQANGNEIDGWIPKVSLTDSDGNAINSLNGALDVHDSHVHRVPVNEYFHEHTGTITNISIAVTAGDTSITVEDATGFAIGDTIQIQNGVIETTLPTITNIVGNVFTLDRPLDNSFDIGDQVEIVRTSLNVTGALESPISFKVIPSSTQVWHIQSFIIAMTHGTAGDDSAFGDIANGLTNGVILRAYNATEDRFVTLTNWKKNKDIRLDAFNLVYSDKAGPSTHGTAADGAFLDRTGAVARVDGTAGDYIELLVQDNLSALATFEVKAQGHIEGL